MAATPPANPSRLSSRLIALVTPTSQKIVSAAIEDRRRQPVQAQAEHRDRRAEQDLPDELGVRLELDGVVDEPDHEHAARAQEQQVVAGRVRRPLTNSVATMNARKMPTPPKSAVGFLCQRSARGLATSLKRRATVRTPNVSATDSDQGDCEANAVLRDARLDTSALPPPFFSTCYELL